MSQLITVETGLSITGSNADQRIPLKPSEMRNWILMIHNALMQIAVIDQFSIAAAIIQDAERGSGPDHFAKLSEPEVL